ncbi:MAG TPA: HEAT repeat domain-containing protein [Kiritimatiellia bacterium]|nr:HEAT repeat domain-containing protein [Kiritimatiellia bacterium]
MSIKKLLLSALLVMSFAACIPAEEPALAEPDPSLKYLLKSLSDKDWKVARDAQRDILQIGSRAVPFLLEMADGRREGNAEAAISVLGKMGDARVGEPLIRLLQTSPDDKVRKASAEALGRLGETRAVDALMAAASHSEKYLNNRYAAIKALGQIKDPRAVTFLMLIMNGDAYLECRNYAADALDAIAGTQFGHDHRRRMEWIRANHPEWLDLNEEQWFIHPGMIWMAGAVVVFALVGFWLIRSTWNSFRHG